MLKAFPVLLFVAIFKIVRCKDLILPQVFIPHRGLTLSLSKNPPKPPLVRLTGEKFALPQFCQNASEWQDVDLSLQILTDYTEPVPERSTFASFINLVKFILIKEGLSCVDAIKGPVVHVKRPEGQIFKAVAKLENSQILKKIETALAKKPKHRAPPIEFYDNIDISNMIPIWRPRSNSRRNQGNPSPATKETKTNSTCKAKPNPNLTVLGGNMKPINKIGSQSARQTKGTLAVLKTAAPNCELQSLPLTNVKPVLGCGGCNICQKLASPVLSGCPTLASAPVFPGCPNTNVVLGCSCPILGPCANVLTGCQPKQSLSVLQSEPVLVDCFGNVVKKVTTTVLVPYTVSQLVA